MQLALLARPPRAGTLRRTADIPPLSSHFNKGMLRPLRQLSSQAYKEAVVIAVWACLVETPWMMEMQGERPRTARNRTLQAKALDVCGVSALAHVCKCTCGLKVNSKIEAKCRVVGSASAACQQCHVRLRHSCLLLSCLS